MSKQTEKIAKASDEITKICRRYKHIAELYMFGSFLIKEFPNDIDLLIVYEDSSPDINILIDEMKILEKTFDLPVDITVLSKNEMKELSFIGKLNNNYIQLI